MAKKKEKTLEEKLQEALVPEKQWPYILPENWCWTRLKYISKKISDGSHNPPKNSGSGIPLLSAANVCEFSIDMDSANRWILEEEWVDENKRTCLEKGDVLLTIVATIGRVAIVENEKFALQRSVAVIKPNQVLSKYLMYFLASPYIQAFMHNNAKGTAQKGFYLKSLEQLYIALPSLSEQKRIVHRIESLFAKLDEAKEKIQQVLDGAEMRKAAILHKAFTGELTKTWRRENNITTTDDVNREKLSKECEEYEIPYEIPDEWRWVTFNEVCTFIGSGVTPKGGQAVYTDSGIPFIRSQNVLNGKLDLSDVAYISDEINEKMKRTQIIGGETLLNITGASIGRSCYVPQEQSVGNVNQHVCILRFKNYINGYIPQLWLNSPKMQEFINFNQVGQTRQALNFKQIRGIYFPLPPLQEQLEMVRIIKYEINKLDVVCNSLANLAVRIDTMKKSILAKAFRGELGTNNPNEDSAINLLKEVLQDKF